MLKKLIKHDFKALGRLLIPAFIFILAAGGVSGAFISILENVDRSGSISDLFLTLIDAVVGIATVFCFLSLFAAAIGSFFFIISRYYQNLLSAEGYLSHTLPVTADQHLISKIITASISTFCLFITTALSFLLFMLTLSFKGTLKGIGKFFNKIGDYLKYWDIRYTAVLFEIIIIILVSAICSILTFYLALTIGNLISKKHKILAAFGSYFVINIVMQIISSVIMVIILLVFRVDNNLENSFGSDASIKISIVETEARVFAASQSLLIPLIIYYSAFCVGLYILNRHIMTKKLNL